MDSTACGSLISAQVPDDDDDDDYFDDDDDSDDDDIDNEIDIEDDLAAATFDIDKDEEREDSWGNHGGLDGRQHYHCMGNHNDYYHWGNHNDCEEIKTLSLGKSL